MSLLILLLHTQPVLNPTQYNPSYRWVAPVARRMLGKVFTELTAVLWIMSQACREYYRDLNFGYEPRLYVKGLESCTNAF